MASDTRELESITVDRTDGVVTITLRRPEKKNAADAAMWNELLAEFRAIAANPADRAVVLTGAGGNFCSGADLWQGASGEAPAAPAHRHAPHHRRVPGTPPDPAAHRGQGARRGCRRRTEHGAVVRPDRRLRERPILRDLRQARPQPRLRRLVAAAPARRDAPGQGTGAPRRDHRRRARRGDGARQPGAPRRRTRRVRRRLGCSPRRRPTDRCWRCRSACSTTRSQSRWRRRSTTRGSRRPSTSAPRTPIEAIKAFMEKRDPVFEGR